MHPIAAADELADIRAEIARLQAREAALRTLLLAAPDSALVGRWHRVEISRQRVRLFDTALLPADIRADPAYWRESLRTVLRTQTLHPRSARPGWPIRRAAGTDSPQRPVH